MSLITCSEEYLQTRQPNKSSSFFESGPSAFGLVHVSTYIPPYAGCATVENVILDDFSPRRRVIWASPRT